MPLHLPQMDQTSVSTLLPLPRTLPQIQTTLAQKNQCLTPKNCVGIVTSTKSVPVMSGPTAINTQTTEPTLDPLSVLKNILHETNEALLFFTGSLSYVQK